MDGSTYKVPLTNILAINPHPNADRLEVATVYGFQVIVRKDQYKVGDSVIYIPIDSVIPQWLEQQLFPEDAKIKPDKGRIKQIRIRKLASQGMLVHPNDVVQVFHHGLDDSLLELDLSTDLGITKYEPPQRGSAFVPGSKKERPKENIHFKKYNGVDNIKWFPNKFREGEQVVVQEKIHGTNARAGILPTTANTLWKKIKKFFGKLPIYEFVYGSNNVQLQERAGYTGYYGEDVYGKVFKQIDVYNKLGVGETIFGEIYGDGIQKDYTYGCKRGEHKFVLFDVLILLPDLTSRYLTPDEVIAYAKERGFDTVPEVYRGPFNMDLVKKLSEGPSVLCPEQKVREGVVVKSLEEYNESNSKKALKVISEVYLDNNNTDFH